MNEEIKQREAALVFFLPEHDYEFTIAARASEYVSALDEIYKLCRTVWKYEENPTPDKVELAEKIGELINATGVRDL